MATPAAGTWTAYFKALHALYPRAQLGFGEIGLGHPVTSRTMSTAKSTPERTAEYPRKKGRITPWRGGGSSGKGVDCA